MDAVHNKPMTANERRSEITEFEKELEAWEDKLKKAEDVRDRLLLESLEEHDMKLKAKEEMQVKLAQEEECQKQFSNSMNAVQVEIQKVDKYKEVLQDKLRTLQVKLNAENDELMKVKRKFKIHVPAPATEVKLTSGKDDDGNDDTIRGVFSISQRSTALLQGGRAIVTFEDEKVASEILKMSRCVVTCGESRLDVKPQRITLDPTVKFEIHLDVSTKLLKVSGVHSSLPKDRVKVGMELSFSRPSRGGGEVERVEYDQKSGTGKITFLHPGVAESLVQRGKYPVRLESEVDLPVEPVHEHRLCKFQVLGWSAKRTLLLDGVNDVDGQGEEDIQENLEIHFQRPSNHGGEIEKIKYISRHKTLQAFFL